MSAVFDTPKKHFLKNIMPRTKKERKVVPLEESPDDGSLEGREPQDTDSSKGGGGGGGGGITCVFVGINNAETNEKTKDGTTNSDR